MRKGLLTSLLVWLGMGGLVAAQPPYPSSPYPPAHPYAAPPAPVPYSFPGVREWEMQPDILVGGALDSKGPLALPSMRSLPTRRPLPRPRLGLPRYDLPERHPRVGVAPPAKRQTVGSKKKRLSGLVQTRFTGGDERDRRQKRSEHTQVSDSNPHEEEVYSVVDDPYGPPPVNTVVEGWRLGPPEKVTKGCGPNSVPRGHKFYGTVEYLHYWMDNFETPPLATVGAPASIIVGGDGFPDIEQRQGYRTVIGLWVDDHQRYAVEGVFFFLGERTPSVSVLSPGDPPINRVFTDANTGLPNGVPIAIPGVGPGGVQVDVLSRVWGFETNVRKELLRFGWGNVDLIGGFRYLQIDEGLSINSQSMFSGPTSGFFNHDFFGTENQFMAGQVGIHTEFRIGKFFGSLWGKCALGMNHQTVLINGATIVGPPTPAGTQLGLLGGVLAQATNIGEREQNEFMVLPEAGVQFGVQLTENVRLGGGYSFMYLPNVVRPGQHIDPVVDPTLIPQLFQASPAGNARPTFAFLTEALWLHGVNVELEFRY